MFKHHFTLQWLLFFLSISTTIYHTSCMEQALHTISLDTEKVDSVPFLFRLFDLPAEFNQLPKDVQYEIVKKLPTPFKPIRPKPIEITHNDINWSDVTGIAFNDDGTRFAIIAPNKDRRDWAFTKLCIDSTIENPDPNAKVITIEGEITEIAFNKSGTQLLLLSHNAKLLTLDNGKIIEQSESFSIELDRMCYSIGIRALSDGTFLIACTTKHIVILDPSTHKVTDLTSPDINRGDDMPHTRFTISLHEDSPLVAYRGISRNHSQSNLFDVKTKTWSPLPEIHPGSNDGAEILEICYNSTRSLLLASYHHYPPRSSCLPNHVVYLWNMKGGTPQLSGRTFRGSSNLCFRHDSLFALVYSFSKLRLYSINTGACVVEIPCEIPESQMFASNHHMFSPKGDCIIMRGEQGLRVWKWNPLWDACASFFEKPTLIEQYLFIKYLHQLGECCLTLNDEGICAQDIHKKRFTDISSPLTKQDLTELKEVFLSFDPLVQKYLRLKYHLLAW